MSDEPRIELNNSSTSQGGGPWKWSVWIDGDGEQLDQIDRVEYVPAPDVSATGAHGDRPQHELQAGESGWGEFMVHAKAVTKQGETLRLNHWLKLSDQGHRGFDECLDGSGVSGLQQGGLSSGG